MMAVFSSLIAIRVSLIQRNKWLLLERYYWLYNGPFHV